MSNIGNDHLKNIPTLINAGKYLATNRLVVGAAGNISTKIDSDSILITKRGAILETLTETDFVVVNLEGLKLWGDGDPTSEIALHTMLYQKRPDINAVVHTHSTNATALAITGRSLPPVVDEATILIGGEVTITDYAPPGTTEIAINALKAMQDKMAVILANHGVITIGKDMQEATKIAILVEHLAGIYLLALGTGEIKRLPEEQIAKQRKLYEKRKGKE